MERSVTHHHTLSNAHIETPDISRNNIHRRVNQWVNNRLKILVSTLVGTFFENLVGSEEFISNVSQSSSRPTQARPFSRMWPLQDLRALAQSREHSRSPSPIASTLGILLSLEDPQKDSLVASRLSPPGDLRKMNLER